MNCPIVDFVVCTWNNRRIISKTLEAIARQTVRNFTCTVVDDQSTDGTPQFVRESFPWVNVVVKEKNSGPSSSRNVGISQGSAKFIVFMDSDVTLDSRWTEVQLKLMNSDSKIGIVCGKLLYLPSPEVLYGAYGAMNRLGIAWDGGFRQREDCFAVPLRCLWANTTALAARRELIERMGGFDGAMFTMYEDADFGWRANLFGYHTIFNPAAVAIHEVHGSLNPENMSRRLIYLVWRNRLRSLLVNYEIGSLLRYTSVYLVLAVLDGLVYGPRKEKLGAIWWNTVHLIDTLRRRSWVQSHRTVRDKELWPLFQGGIRGPGYGIFRGADLEHQSTSSIGPSEASSMQAGKVPRTE